MKILLEMRPALLGHAGIPQETRLLFRMLTAMQDVQVDGLIQSGARVLAPGLPAAETRRQRLRIDARINRLSRVVISLQRERKLRLVEQLEVALAKVGAPASMMVRHLLGMKHELTYFDATHFRDFIWRALFAKTLPVQDFESVTRADFRVSRVPWESMHICALITRLLGRALYPRLDTRGYDLMIGETPYPGTVSQGTQLVVRYHDAIPLLMPHTISDRFFHQAFHYHALRRNVESGAWFSCVSEATRKDLLTVFPQAEQRAVTIHNMVSHHYFSEDSSPVRIPEILATRLLAQGPLRNAQTHRSAILPTGPESGAATPEYILIVSTIEPRKNHLTLLAAWEQLRAERFSRLKLVVVGAPGWDHKPIIKRFRPWVENGTVFLLSDVPAAELRVLYKHARVTVCPSFGEGFDFSGVEAMRCGGIVAASDIPVHREVFGNAAEYFNPYSAQDLAGAIARVIDPQHLARRQELIEQGASIASRYLPERLVPQWQRFLKMLVPGMDEVTLSESIPAPQALRRGL